jgi:hypothetical protein
MPQLFWAGIRVEPAHAGFEVQFRAEGTMRVGLMSSKGVKRCHQKVSVNEIATFYLANFLSPAMLPNVKVSVLHKRRAAEKQKASSVGGRWL